MNLSASVIKRINELKGIPNNKVESFGIKFLKNPTIKEKRLQEEEHRYKELNELIQSKKPAKQEKPVTQNKTPCIRKQWKEYEQEARRLTKLQPIVSLLENGKLKCSHCTHFDSDSHYVIDHKISIWYGFNNGITVENISSMCNLRWITAKENRIKNTKNFVDCKNRHLLVSQNQVLE